MSRPKEPTLHRAWYVLGPVALILTGVGWLALGLSIGAGMRPPSPPGRVVRATVTRGAGRTVSVSRPLALTWIQNSATGSSYAVIPARTWLEGQAYAAELGGSLVTVDSAAEQAWLVRKFGGEENFWIGLTDVDTEGRWRWADGKPVAYTNWAVDEPNNVHDGEHYGVMNWRVPGVWNDMNAPSASASNVRAAIVERPAGGGLSEGRP